MSNVQTTQAPRGAEWSGRAIDSSALLAGLVANVLPLLGGLGAGWPLRLIIGYSALALFYLILIAFNVSNTPIGRWLCNHKISYLALVGAVGLGLTVLSGDGFVQPIVFTVPYVHAVMYYGRRGAVLAGGAYLALTALGLWLHGAPDLATIAYPVLVYAALMVFMAAFVSLASEQRLARQRADDLAAELGRERDAMAALAAENARLAAENALTATLAERNRIARELHDTIAQGLTAVTMQLEAAQRAFERDPERARTRLERAHELSRETLAEVRRSVWTLAAPVVEGPALVAALDEATQRFVARTGVPASYQHEGPPLNLASERAVQVLRIVQEALQNVEKHASAGRVEVGSRAEAGGTALVWVRDNGRGFDPMHAPSNAGGSGFGLRSLDERARLAAAQLSIESAPSQGTTVCVTLDREC